MAKKPNRHRKTDWRRVPRTGRVACMEIRSVSESPTMEKLLKQHHARDVSASTLQQLAGGGFAQIINCSGRAHICGNEAACLQDNDSTSRCICPHDLSPPTLDLKCPNRNTVSMTPKPIPNIMPPTTLPGTEQIEAVETRLPEVMVIVIGCAFVLTMLIGVVLYYFKRRNFDTKSTSSDLEASPMNLKESLLLANKYAPNPQYFSCASQDVPVLQRNSLVFIKDIGEGFFGKVYKGELIRDDKTEVVAIKVLKVTANKEAEEDFMREVETMSSFRHENILSLLGVVGRDDSNGPWMIFEYMPFGDLAEVLRANAPSFRAHIPGLQPLTKDSLLWITTQIASGMAYLAAQRFVHRDLACRNCLVGEDLVVKIADFGMTRDVYTCDYYRIGGSRMLPVRWMSPESVVYGRFTLESDIYSFGVLLWEVYTFGKQPYFGHSNEEAVQLIMDGVLLVPPDDCPSFVCQLMRDCWRESRERPAFAEILERLQKADKFEGSASNGCRIATLPRPPPGLVTVRTPDVLDADGYLLPSPVATREYIQAVPA